jgi:F-type H+-transporting ATPase subunit epsilon
LEAEIAEMQESLAKKSPGAELDRAIAQLDHYKSIQMTLTPTAAF